MSEARDELALAEGLAEVIDTANNERLMGEGLWLADIIIASPWFEAAVQAATAERVAAALRDVAELAEVIRGGKADEKQPTDTLPSVLLAKKILASPWFEAAVRAAAAERAVSDEAQGREETA